MVHSRSYIMLISMPCFILNSRSCFIVVHVFVVDLKSCYFYILFSIRICNYVKMELFIHLACRKLEKYIICHMSNR